MDRKLPEYWEKVKSFSLKRTACNREETDKKTKSLLEEFKSRGYIKMLPLEALKIDDAVICNFYLDLAEEKIVNGVIPSPVENNSDSSWVYYSDFCFINVRAVGIEPEKTGTFLNAMKLVPIVRCNSIHLAPFFDCALHNLYAVDSLRVISRDILSPFLLEAGLEADNQLMLLVDGIHMLGKTVGFDLEPHTSQFSRLVLENPQHFRWIRFARGRKGLYNKTSHVEMLKEESQEKLQKEVKKIIGKVLKKNKIKSLEDPSSGVEIIKKSHQEIINKLIADGYWTLPSQTWGGIGLPEFDFYNFNENYPDFIYLNSKGEDQHKHSFGMLTPYKFYKNLPFNRLPEDGSLPQNNDNTIEYFKSIFPDIQDRYKFDFVRLDYVDHVFDSTLNNSWDIPVSDRMTPQVLHDVINTAKNRKKFTGAIAERMLCDICEYKKLGFDLVLGNTMLTTIHAGYMRYNFDLQEQLEKNISSDGVPSSVMFAVDTHDTGHPLFWTASLSEVVGHSGMHLRHFLSRFTWSGKARRPKYEIIGNQDLSFGLYEANNKLKSLVWVGDITYNELYHGVEDAYERFKELIFKSHIGPTYVAEDCAFWFLDREDGCRERLLCVVALEKKFDNIKDVIKEKPVYAPVSELIINFLEDYYFENPEISEVDLTCGELRIPNQISYHQLAIKEIPPLGTKLFYIREKR